MLWKTTNLFQLVIGTTTFQGAGQALLKIGVSVDRQAYSRKIIEVSIVKQICFLNLN